MSEPSHDNQAISRTLNYAMPRHGRRRLLLRLMISVSLCPPRLRRRASGRIRPFYNQGGV
jgi:hypothetical protein